MGILRAMGPNTGDEALEWDPHDEKAVRRARKKFNKMVKPKKGDGKFKAYSVKNVGGKREADEPMAKFDPKAAEILLVPQLAGG